MTLALSFINRVLVTAVQHDQHHHWTCRQRPRRWRQIQGKTAQSQRPVASQQPPLEFFLSFLIFCVIFFIFFLLSPQTPLEHFLCLFPLYDPPLPWIFYLSFISPKNFPWRFSLSLKMWEAYSRWAKWTMNNEHCWQCHVVQHFGENAGPERQNDWKTRKIAKNWHFFFSYLVT